MGRNIVPGRGALKFAVNDFPEEVKEVRGVVDPDGLELIQVQSFQ